MATKKHIVPLLVVLLVGCSQSAAYVPGAHRAEVLARLGLTDTFDPADAALEAREWVYKANNPVPPSPSPYSTGALYQAYAGLASGTTGYYCDGMAFVYYFILRELGLDARVVIIGDADYFTTGNTLDTHTTVDVYLDGRWVSMDPTFNVTYQCNGADSSVVDLVACHEDGKTVTWSYGGVVYAGRTLEEYYIPLTVLLYGYQIWTTSRP